MEMLDCGELPSKVLLGPGCRDASAPQQIGDEEQDEHPSHQDDASKGDSEGRERHKMMLPAVITSGGRAPLWAIRSGTIVVFDPPHPPHPPTGCANDVPGAMSDPVSRTKGGHRTRWIVGCGVLLVVVSWGAVVAVHVWSAYRHDQRGLAALTAVRSNSDPSTLTASATERSLRAAATEFSSADAALSGPLITPVTVVPVLGRQIRSARSLSAAAEQVSTIGSNFLVQVHDVLDQPHGPGPQRVQSLRHLSALSLVASRQLHAIDTGPSRALVSPLASKHDEFVTQLNDVRIRLAKAAGVSAVVANILQGPQNYLVLAANNAEMRAGSGSFLEVGVADTADGSLHLGEFRQSGQLALAPGQVTVTGDLQRNWGWLKPGVDWRNLGLTPQFDVTAPLAARMWEARTGQQVDGVLAVDIAALSEILKATGPIQAGGTTIGPDNVEQFLLHDQYAGLSDDSAENAARADALGEIAQAVLRQLQGQSTDLRALASSVAGAVAGRHLMVWSRNPVAQAAWATSGASGSLTPQSLAVSVVSRGGNKLDQFLYASVALATRTVGSDTAVTMTTHLTNRTPSEQAQFIAGPYPGLGLTYGDYAGIVANNLPAAASHITMTGTGPLTAKGAEGPTWLVAGPVLLHAGASTTVVVHFRLPGVHGSMTVMPSARVPSEQWTYKGAHFTDERPVTLRW